MTRSDWRRVELLAAAREHNRRLRLIVAFQAIAALLSGRLFI